MATTIIIWDNMDGNILYYAVPGDHRAYDRIYANCCYDDEDMTALAENVTNLTHDEAGNLQEGVTEYNRFPTHLVMEDAYIINCGFVL